MVLIALTTPLLWPSPGERCVRLWTIDPGYVDAVGLVAFWREALLACAVLEGTTRGTGITHS
jgi:hypothetical protein